MPPAPFPRLQASPTGAAEVVVEQRRALIFYARIEMVEARGQLGKHQGGFSGAVRLGVLEQVRGVELVHRCLSEGRKIPRVCSKYIVCSMS